MEKKLQTVGDIREAISQSGGTINLGRALRLSYDSSNPSDVDVYLFDSLLCWIPKSTDGEVQLAIAFTFIDGWENSRTLKEEAARKLAEAEAKCLELESQNATLQGSTGLDAGKVAAYEKLLIGREVTIGR